MNGYCKCPRLQAQCACSASGGADRLLPAGLGQPCCILSWDLTNAGLLFLLQARRQFQSQLADLQQLPDILKITEAKLAECQDQLQGYERKNIDLTAIISDLRSRVRDWQKGSHELARAGARLPR